MTLETRSLSFQRGMLCENRCGVLQNRECCRRACVYSPSSSFLLGSRGFCLAEVEAATLCQTTCRLSTVVVTSRGRSDQEHSDRRRGREKEGEKSTCTQAGGRRRALRRRTSGSMLHGVTPRTEWGDREGPGSEAVARGGGEVPRGWHRSGVSDRGASEYSRKGSLHPALSRPPPSSERYPFEARRRPRGAAVARGECVSR